MWKKWCEDKSPTQATHWWQILLKIAPKMSHCRLQARLTDDDISVLSINNGRYTVENRQKKQDVNPLRTTGWLVKRKKVSWFKPIRHIVRMIVIFERSEPKYLETWFSLATKIHISCSEPIRNVVRKAVDLRKLMLSNAQNIHYILLQITISVAAFILAIFPFWRFSAWIFHFEKLKCGNLIF